jgi:hypothetical protein
LWPGIELGLLIVGDARVVDGRVRVRSSCRGRLHLDVALGASSDLGEHSCRVQPLWTGAIDLVPTRRWWKLSLDIRMWIRPDSSIMTSTQPYVPSSCSLCDTYN